MPSHRRTRFALSRLNTHARFQPGRLQRCECSSSLLVLAAVGVLAFALPHAAWAQSAGTVLPRGTVPVLRSVVSGAVVGAPTATATGQLLTITQQQTRAIIDWEKFNIANGSEVRFIQPSAIASALNRIYSADPTIIQGRLTANGQVLLINQNGILFDRGSQVNVNALVASTLNISNDTYNRGLTSGANSTAAAQGGYQLGGNGSTDPSLTVTGAVRIGAHGDPSAAAPVIRANPGGNIMVFAPVIDNRNGLITSPDGQVVLAAGSKAYLTDVGADSQGVRGVLVEVSADNGPVDLTSLVRNQGTITADRGNVTLAGLAINQAGRVSASTAVLYDGSIWLKAGTVVPGAAGGLVPERAGTVELAAGSVTETPLDTTDTTRISESTDYASTDLAKDRRGSIRIDGGTIVHRGSISAPGGRIDITAKDTAQPANARIYLDEGSVISAAGNWADVDYASNLLTFRVTSNELKDAPLQKEGLLRGQTVTVDLRKGSEILDLSGYQDGRLRSVAEKAAVGGDVSLRADAGTLIQRTGSVVDVSGGGYAYEGGRVATTQLLGADGKSYDIGTASRDRTYVAQLDKFTRSYDRWGQTVVYNQLNVAQAATEAGYLEGQRGGNLVIAAASGMVLDGTLKGGATTGTRQLGSAPRGASLMIGTNLNLEGPVSVANVTFSRQATDTLGSGFDAFNTALTDAQRQQLTLSTETLFAGEAPRAGASFEPGRFDKVEINSRGLIALPADVTLEPGVESTLTLRAQQIDIAGKVNAPSGSVVLQTVAPPAGSDATAQPNRITLQSGASISTTGLWLNNASRDGSAVGPLLPAATSVEAAAPTSALNGGSISLSSESVDLQLGSTLDVSGGGRVARNNAVTAGNAGSISISAVQAAGAPDTNRFAGELRGYALGTGGSLSIALGQMQIGGGVAPIGATRFDAGLFTQGGFRAFDLSGARGLTVVENTRIEPRVESWQIDPLDAAGLVSGGDLASIATRVVLPAHEQRPTSVSLRARGANTTDAKVDIREGASVLVNAGGSITLDAADGMEVHGLLQAQGGSISLGLNGRPDVAASALHLGESARLIADGTFVPRANDLDLRQGTLLGGGVVTLNTTNATVVADAGSLISVDGSSQVLDRATQNPLRPYQAVVSRADAGTVIIRAQDEVRLNGALSGRAPDAQSAGGSFALELTNRADISNPANTGLARRVVVTQAPAQIAAEPGSVDANIGINTLSSGGFDKLRLAAQDKIELRGPLSLGFARGVWLDAPELLVASDQRVNVSGATVVLANSFGQMQLGSPAKENAAPSAIVGTLAGLGSFNVSANTVDLYGDLTINGVQSTQLSARDDLRLTGRAVGSASAPEGAQLTGSLTTAGDLSLQAAQVYPTTQSRFTLSVAERAANTSASTVVEGGTLTVSGNGRQGGTVYSAGGKLTLEADTIRQAGVVKAPLGEIRLNATTSLDLAAGSLTSVSAAGTLIPYGSTVAGVSWLYGTTNANATTNDIKDAPEKRILLSGAEINQHAGATIDASGGGDLLATEFVPGSGGSKDVLVQPNTYAIIPSAQLAAMPVDGDIAKLQDTGFGTYTANKDRAVYDSIHIGPGAAVPEGDYTLLPGRYALLPGAYMVQLQTGSSFSEMASGSSQPLLNGQTAVAGYRTVAGTPIRESRTVGVVVRPGSDARKESDYNQSGSSFFATLAAQERRVAGAVAADAGALSISAIDKLDLSGNFNTAPATAGGRAAEVDISADRIALVDRIGQTGVDAGFLQIEAATLSRIQGSLLIGGTRSNDGENVRVSAGARDVLVANSSASPVRAPDLLLAASDSIEVRGGSVLSGAGTATGRVRDITADAGGALIRLSNAEQVTVDRGGSPDASHGRIDIQAGAVLGASKSMLLDATDATTSRGTLNVGAGGALSLAAGGISLGDGADPSATGLALTNAQLQQYNNLDALTLKSYGSIDLLGSAQVGSASLNQLTLDTGLLRGLPGASPQAEARISAGTVTLLNSTGVQASSSGGTGTLAINAGSIRTAAGDKAIGGFSQVNLDATGDVVAVGAGTLRVGGDLAVRSARIVSESGAQQAWKAVDDSQGGAPLSHQVVLSARPLAAGSVAPTALGSGLAVEGRSIESGARIVMASGTVALSALGTGANDAVHLTSGGVIDVGGAVRNFNDVAVATNGGNVKLFAAGGEVRVDAGAALRLDGTAQGGDAGRLDIDARQLQLNGEVTAAAAAGQAGGRSRIDLQTLADFSALNRTLETAGFTDTRELRLRQGDLAVAAGDTVTARQIVLSADAGRIDIDGTLNASTVLGGGSVGVYAQNGLRIGDSALIDASGRSTAADGAPSNGGRVALDTRSGTLDFAPGARIDVRAGAAGAAGTVAFTAARTAGNDGIDANLRGTVVSQRHAGDAAAEVAIEARRVYTAADTADIALYEADHVDFMGRANAAALTAGIRGDDGNVQANAHVRGAVELQTAGDFASTGDWVLTPPAGSTTGGWLAGAEPGSLTIRAAGDLVVGHAIGLPNDDLFDGKTWNIRLTGGADLGAANAMTTARPAELAGKGSVVLDGPGAKVRTGTGSIDIAAGRDFVMTSSDAVVYTSGVAAAANPASTSTDPNPAAGITNPWVKEGGSIRISAQQDAVGTSDQWINDWLRRPRGSLVNSRLSGWWAYRPNFQQNIASFGGGDIEIAAGRNVDKLSAMSPTSGRVSTVNGVAQLDVQGGGNLLIEAGGDVLGGEYLVGRGTGVIRAAGKVGLAKDADGLVVTPATQLYLMGESDDVSRRQASMRIDAVGDIALQSVDNPTILQIRQSSGPGANFAGGQNSAYFYTYSENSRVDLSSMAGDITLGSVPLEKPFAGFAASRGSAYAASLSAVAFDGSIRGLADSDGGAAAQPLTLFPSATGSLRLLAGQDVTGLNIVGSDRSPSTVSAWNRNDENTAAETGNTFLDLGVSTPRIVSRPQSDGYAYDVQALAGSLNDSSFTFPAVSRLRAGLDIARVEAILQNLSEGDTSLVRADAGELRPNGISIGGPGRLLMQAGSSVDIQSPLTANGNLLNPSLTTGTSARLTVIAGVNGNLDLAKLDAAYLELIEAGKAKDDVRGQAAMNEFWGTAGLSAGDIRSFLTSIETLGGSDIDLLAPKGDITVGLTTPVQGSTGVVTNAGGAIRSYLEGNFNINRGKVVTAQGGDILIYTSQGNIDAGRGAKTSATTPAPQRVPVTDDENVVIGYRYLLPSGVAGSGIQTVTSDPDGPGPSPTPDAGSVYLFAPSGFVDAGEAGIVSGANIFIAAQIVLNASNISSAGSSVGVPVAEAGSLASSLASSGAPTSAGNKAAEEVANAASAASKAAAAVSKPNILTVEVLGFGDKNCKEQEKDCFAK